VTEAAALLAAIRAAPDDDAPRLIYADWLDEHGQPERAEFIRVQVELARAETPALRRREAELLASHHDAFAGPLAAPHLRFKFERGLISGFGHNGVFVRPYGPFVDAVRFFADGQLLHVAGESRVDPIPYSGWVTMRSGQPGVRIGTYVLTGMTYPLRFQVSVANGSGQIDHYRGEVKRRAIRLIRRNGSGGLICVQRCHFDHYPIPGFDSFPET
jgi:uncharacterized protein (TIGR02996 family)